MEFVCFVVKLCLNILVDNFHLNSEKNRLCLTASSSVPLYPSFLFLSYRKPSLILTF
jgi:hypothetical protein